MAKIDELKKTIDERISKFRMQLRYDGMARPVVLSFAGDLPVSEVEVNMESDQDHEDLGALMKSIASAEATECIALIIDMYRASAPVDEADKIPEKLSEDPNSGEAVVTFVHTREGSYLKEVRYVQDDRGRYTFFDTGWQIPNDFEGLFANPFISNKIEDRTQNDL